ncbi:MAG TPA: DUF3147 family protein [Acidobacteriaceae bacterium]|nr:DUF3147 family protein [Acidobacteriaceae bacterium]
MIGVNLSGLRSTRPHEYAIRFVFGGSATVLAGFLAYKFGAGIGGLFLAFPAIFPASATLVSAHERERKHRVGLHGTERGRSAAAIDATGAALGSMGLLAFAFVVWRMLPGHNPWLVIGSATIVWIVVAFAFWKLRQLRHIAIRAWRRR